MSEIFDSMLSGRFTLGIFLVITAGLVYTTGYVVFALLIPILVSMVILLTEKREGADAL